MRQDFHTVVCQKTKIVPSACKGYIHIDYLIKPNEPSNPFFLPSTLHSLINSEDGDINHQYYHVLSCPALEETSQVARRPSDKITLGQPLIQRLGQQIHTYAEVEPTWNQHLLLPLF